MGETTPRARTPLRLAFMGSPDFAVPALQALHMAGHDIRAVYTQPPKPAGRGQQETPCPVHRAALALGLEVRSPTRVKRDAAAHAAFAALDLDVAVVAAYGLILPQAVLDAPRLGCLNVHGSILPRWRGAAPVQRAILAGDETTGVTIMQMERGLDTGPMLAKVETPVDGKTAGELTEELAGKGAGLMVEVLADIAAYTPVVQPEEGVTYAHKIDKAESRLDFTRGAVDVERQVRAFAPAPGAFFELEGERYRILAAQVVDAQGEVGVTLDDALTIACGSGAIRPVLIQRAGRPAMDAVSLLRGRAIASGTRLG